MERGGIKPVAAMQAQVLWDHVCGDKDGDREPTEKRGAVEGVGAQGVRARGSAPRTSRRARGRRRLLPAHPRRSNNV